MEDMPISDRTSPDCINYDPVKLARRIVTHDPSRSAAGSSATAPPLPSRSPLLCLAADRRSAALNRRSWSAGVGVTVASAKLIRLWAVHHIGAISRTRSERLGPLVAAGPFA